MEGNRNSYGNILKSIGLFGGVKVLQILVSIIRNKFVAVLLGPVGMGISSMLTSTTTMVGSLTGLGLHTSSVRDIAKASQSKDEQRIGVTTTVVRRFVYLTGILGVALVFFMAPLLSEWSFGNGDYAAAYRIVSVIMLFDQLRVGQTALIQGTFHYRYMASASLLGSIIGLIVTVPLYYIWNIDAIVPVIILTSLTSLVLSWYYSRKIKLKEVRLSIKEIWKEGKGMIVLGLAIALAGLVGTGKSYVLRAIISRYGDIADVGLYTAGIAIATQYMDVVLQAMGTDYSPRLAAVSEDKGTLVETINRQLKLLITIITPLIIPFVVLIRELTIVLYSTKFIPIAGMIEWIMVGMFFRTISWCYSYSIIAIGASRLFFISETVSVLISLSLSILGYKWCTFTGMGIAFCAGYIIYTIIMYCICKYKFNYKVSKDAFRNIAILFSLLFVTFVAMRLLDYSWPRYVIGLVMTVVTGYASYRLLDEMIPVKQKVMAIINRMRPQAK